MLALSLCVYIRDCSADDFCKGAATMGGRKKCACSEQFFALDEEDCCCCCKVLLLRIELMFFRCCVVIHGDDAEKGKAVILALIVFWIWRMVGFQGNRATRRSFIFGGCDFFIAGRLGSCLE